VGGQIATLQFEGQNGLLDLGWGHPDPSLLPVRAWNTATTNTLTTFGWKALAYGNAAGPGPLIEWLQTHLEAERESGADGHDFFISAGASHALSLLTSTMTVPGDIVLVDSPTYHFALRIFADAPVELMAAPTDSSGIHPGRTEELLLRLKRDGRRPAMLYIVPTFANPTGRSLSDERRRALVDLSARTHLTIVEDDTYRELAYESPAPESLWHLDRRLGCGAAVLRVGSFSKTVAPGLRLGWINAQRDVVRRLTQIGYVDSGGGVNHSTAMTMATFGRSGAYTEHLSHIRKEYRLRRDTLVAALGEVEDFVTIPKPLGGWFLWLSLPEGVTARTLEARSRRHGVAFAQGSQFFVANAGGHSQIRLSFSLFSPEQLVDAASRLSAALVEAVAG